MRFILKIILSCRVYRYLRLRLKYNLLLQPQYIHHDVMPAR